MLETYFKRCLEAFGFDPTEMEISYSIGFCQGDYVSFQGQIKLSTAKRLFMKMHGIDVGPESDSHTLEPDEINHMFLVLENFGQCDLSITDRYGSRAMYVETSDDFESIFDYDFQAILSTFNGDIEWEHGNAWHKRWRAFLKWLKESVDALATKLLFDGHEITLACTHYDSVIREKETPNYLVQVCCNVDHRFDVKCFDESLQLDMLTGLRDGTLMAIDMYAIVLDSSTKRELGRSMNHSYCGPNVDRDSDYLELQRTLVSEAIHDTRALLERHQAIA